jgi:hypothetical protein
LNDASRKTMPAEKGTAFETWGTRPFVQHVEGSGREKGRRKNFDSAMSGLVDDLNKVTTRATP